MTLFPMLLTDVGTDVQPYLGDEWVMQQKHDGARVLVEYDLKKVRFLSRSGEPLKFSAAVLKLEALEAEIQKLMAEQDISTAVFDGELIIETGVLHVFDVVALICSNNILVDGTESLATRMAVLDETAFGQLMHKVVTARTTTEKLHLWKLINDAQVEGAVSKRLDSIYLFEDPRKPGRPARSKDWVKHKLVKTADVVVMAADRTFDHKGMVTHGSAELGVPIPPEDDPQPWRLFATPSKRLSHLAMEELAHGSTAQAKKALQYVWDPRTMLPIGNASLIGKELTIDVGSVVEVDYLSFSGTALVQPRIVRQRFDKTADDCEFSQFPVYTRDVVTL